MEINIQKRKREKCSRGVAAPAARKGYEVGIRMAVCEMFAIGKAIVRIKRSSFRVVPFSYRDLIYSLTITRA